MIISENTEQIAHSTLINYTLLVVMNLNFSPDVVILLGFKKKYITPLKLFFHQIQMF